MNSGKHQPGASSCQGSRASHARFSRLAHSGAWPLSGVGALFQRLNAHDISQQVVSSSKSASDTEERDVEPGVGRQKVRPGGIVKLRAHTLKSCPLCRALGPTQSQYLGLSRPTFPQLDNALGLYGTGASAGAGLPKVLHCGLRVA
jgi:hypothetical protein